MRAGSGPEAGVEHEVRRAWVHASKTRKLQEAFTTRVVLRLVRFENK